MNNEIEMPPTVSAFFADPAVRTAVEALLEMEADVLPPGLQFAELDTYYRARGGAELTRYDIAHLLQRLWNWIWGRQIGPHWCPATLDEMIEEDLAVTPEQIWADKSFTVYHHQNDYVLYTNISIAPGSLGIAFSLEHGTSGEVLILEDFPPFRWHDDEDWSGWQVTTTKFDPKGSLPDLSPLLEAAMNAWSAAEATVATREV